MSEAFVAGVGRLNMDLIYTDLPRLPELGEELYSDGFYMGLGGGIPGSLVSLKRLGIPVKLGTWLGEDYASAFVAARLEEEGISPVNIYHGKGIPVNITSAMVTPGDRTFVTYGCMASEAGEDDIYSICHGAKVALMTLSAPDAYHKIKQEGTALVLDPGYEEHMNLKTFSPYLEIADWYLPNRKEALTITNESDYEQAAKKLAVYTGRAIVKLDRGGAYLYEKGKGILIPTVPAERRDSTGAGDAFLAGFVYGMIRGFDAATCIRCGNISGANCVSGYGCLSARLTEADMAERLERYYNIRI